MEKTQGQNVLITGAEQQKGKREKEGTTSDIEPTFCYEVWWIQRN
jgi:hypothetical protein